MQRRIKLPRPASAPRSLLDESRHASLDVSLKNLKLCSRRIQIALQTFKEEYRILDRTYYKGKNQHRGTLFWKRVVEIRRYCSRVDDGHINSLVEALRSSFYGGGTHVNFKGPWTHYPDAAYIAAILRRMSSLCALVAKMQTRLEGAYELLTRTMQPGAFLQLMLILTAIVARLAAISSELREALAMTSKTIESISSLLQLDSSQVSEAIKNTEQATPMNITRDPPVPLETTQNIMQLPPSQLTSTIALTLRMIRRENVHSANKAEGRAPRSTSNSRKGKLCQDEIDEIFGF